ncbi:MAG: tRNA lysidine(34) synthetase TilS, partial [Chloroflexia bacterium]
MSKPDKKLTVGLPEKVLAHARERGLERYLLEERLVVGVSGGADSLALLHVLYELRGESAGGRGLRVAYLDHGFRGEEGTRDSEFVREVAKRLELACIVGQDDVPYYARKMGLSAEEAARKVRYAFLWGLAAGWGAHVAVGHSADDQVETVLLHLLRGSGLNGLGGMRMLRLLPEVGKDEPFLGGYTRRRAADPVMLFRPLLAMWRREIEEYCWQTGLWPRFDESNADVKYSRNRVRAELIPMLVQQYDPAIKRRLYRLSEIAAEESALLDELAQQVAMRIAKDVGKGGVVDDVLHRGLRSIDPLDPRPRRI